MARNADGVCAARIRLAEILFREWATTHKRIASHVTWAAAHRSQTAQITISANTARAITRIFANAIETGGATGWAVDIAITLRTAFCVW